MNKAGIVLFVKFIVTLALAWLSLGVVNQSPFAWIILVALAATVLNYFIGDMVVLPAMGNMTATLGDGVMASLTAFVVDLLVPAFQSSLAGLVIFGLLVAVGEYFLHRYLTRSEQMIP